VRAVGGIPPLALPSAAQRASTDDWRIDLRPLVAHKFLFIAVVLVTIGAVAALTMLSPKHYTATAKMLIGDAGSEASGKEPGTLLPILNALVAMRGEQSAETYAELLQERPVAEKVIADLGLHATPKQLLGNVAVKPVSNTSVLAVSATASTRDEAANVANAFARVFVDRERTLVMNQAEEALTFLSQAIPNAARTLRDAQGRLAAYESKVRIPDVAAQTQAVLARSAQLNTKIDQTEVDRAQAAAQLIAVNGALAKLPTDIANSRSVVPNPLYAQLSTQQAQLRVQLSSARAQYTDNHPAVIGLRQQLAGVDAQLKKTQRTIVADSSSVANPLRQQLAREAIDDAAAFAAAKAAGAALHTQRAQLDAELQRLPALSAAVSGLTRDVQLAENTYDQLQRKFTEATVAKTTALSDVTIISEATPQETTRRPSLGANLLLGLALGLVLGITTVYALALLDTTVKDERQIVSTFGVAVLANIPQFPAASASTRAIGTLAPPELPALPSSTPLAPAGAAAVLPGDVARRLSYESFLELVASLRYSSDTPLRSLCVAAPQSGCGSSTVALNAAIALAELQGPVLLVDADMRRPAVYGGMRVRRPAGLSDVLAGVKPLSSAVRSSGYEGLDVLSGGSVTPTALKLLQSDAFARLVTQTTDAYRCVVFDAPALNSALDAAVIAEHVDGTVLVVSAGSTDVRAVGRALDRLRAVDPDAVLGVVVNRSTTSSDDRDLRFLQPDDTPGPAAPTTTGLAEISDETASTVRSTADA
jgi:tyrosine-protein kinase Etk/Wzc